MSNPAVITQFVHVDPNAAPLNINELIDVLNPALTSQIQGSYTPYIVQSGTPSVSLTGYIWLEQDSTGRPLSTKIVYGGSWRRVYNGMLGEIRMFSGDPTITTSWDTNGHGVIGSMYDGWQICNGKNSSPDLSDKFILAAHMNNVSGHVGFSSGNWQSFIDGTTDQTTGGAANAKVTLDAAHTYRPAVNVNIYTRQTSGDTASAAPPGTMASTQPATSFVANLYNDPGNTSPTPINISPPFIVFGFIIFQGY